MKLYLAAAFIFLAGVLSAQETNTLVPANNSAVQTQTQLKVKQAIEKKAEYHRLTGGVQEGYSIKIHFGIDHDKSKAIRAKFAARFPEYTTREEYQLPNFVVLVGDFKTKREAFESYKKIQGEFPNSFIVKGKIKVK